MNTEAVIALLVVPIFVAAFAGVGGTILRAAGHGREAADAFRLAPIAVALGFATYSYLAYLLVLAGPPNVWLVVALLAAGIVVGRSYLRALLGRELWASMLPKRVTPLFVVLLLLALATLAVASMEWLTPAKEGDAIAGYTFTARWISWYGLRFNPYNVRYSLMPINTELVESLAFAFGTDLVAKLLEGALGLFFVLGIYELARRCGAAPLYAFFAAASLAVMPDFNRNWSSGKIDVPSSFIFFCALSLLFVKERPRPFATLAAAAFLVGTACSQKYTFWIFAVTFPLCVFLVFKDAPRPQLVKALALSCAIIGVCLVPHVARGLLWARNPIAPIAQTTFDPSLVTLPHKSDAIKTGLRDVPRLPLMLFFHHERWFGLIPLMILFGVPLFLFARNKPYVGWLVAIAAAAQMALWIVARREDWLVERFMLAPLALLLVVSALGLDRAEQRTRLVRYATTAVMVFLIAYLGVWTLRDRRASLAFILGRETRAAWQQRVAPGRGYVPMHEVAPLLGPTARLMVGVAYFNIPREALPYVSTEAETTIFSKVPFEERLAHLREQGYAFYVDTSGESADWKNGLEVFAEGPHGAPFRIYRVDGAAAPSPAP